MQDVEMNGSTIREIYSAPKMLQINEIHKKYYISEHDHSNFKGESLRFLKICVALSIF